MRFRATLTGMVDGDAIRSILPSEVDVAKRLLARAFYDNPGMVWGLPDANRRLVQLEWMMELMVIAGQNYGRVEVLGEPLAAVSVWYPPEKSSLSMFEMLRVGLWRGPRALGWRDFSTVLRGIVQLEQQHAKAQLAPHHYLHVLGVEPSRQRQGLGSRLLGAALAATGGTGRGWYLETDKPEDVAFYEKHGFSGLHEFALGGNGATIWTMRREGSGLRA
jgi:GNAT superfamily N-acetyltransferase